MVVSWSIKPITVTGSGMDVPGAGRDSARAGVCDQKQDEGVTPQPGRRTMMRSHRRRMATY
jgi:hypothetical protein